MSNDTDHCSSWSSLYSFQFLHQCSVILNRGTWEFVFIHLEVSVLIEGGTSKVSKLVQRRI